MHCPRLGGADFAQDQDLMPFVAYRVDYSAGLKSSLPTPQTGHTQLSGMSSKAVPGAIPLSGSPTAGSYSYPQMLHVYFFILLRV